MCKSCLSCIFRQLDGDVYYCNMKPKLIGDIAINVELDVTPCNDYTEEPKLPFKMIDEDPIF